MALAIIRILSHTEACGRCSKCKQGILAYTVTGLDNPANLALAPQGTPLWQTTYHNFAPRVGMAYQLSQAAGRETVLRGGFGFFYDLGTGTTGNALFAASFPHSSVKALSNVPFPLDAQTVAPLPFTLNPPYNNIIVFDPHLKLPRTYQWNVAVEQSCGSQQTISLSYVAAVGRRLLRQELLVRPNPTFTQVPVTKNTGTSDYHALQLQFQRRLSRGLQALASYTWSHSIDTASSDTLVVPPGAKLDPKIDRGPSDFDVRHSFAAAVTYDFPAPFAKSIAGAVLRSWSMDAIFRARSATPVNIDTGTPLFDVYEATRPDLIPGVPLYVNDPTVAGGKRINAAAFSIPPNDRQGTLGRNALRGFPISQVDFALRREFKLTERLNLQFRADFFNLLNHPNFADPYGYLPDAQYGIFGESLVMLRDGLSDGGGLNRLYQVGGPRSTQLALKLRF